MNHIKFVNTDEKLLFWIGIALAVLTKALPLLFTKYPIGIGGLGYQVVGQIVEDRELMPKVIRYYNGGMPFAYPPLGFYITSTAAWLFGGNNLYLYLLLPVVYCISFVPIFGLLSYEVFGKSAALTALFAFSVCPNSVGQLIYAFGVIRSPAYIIYILGLFFLYKYFKKGNPSMLGLAGGVSSALALLTHPVVGYCMALTSAYTIGYYVLRKKSGLIRVAIYFAISASVLLIPYALYVYNQGFVSNYINAFYSRAHVNPLLGSIFFDETGEIFVTVWNAFAVLGIVFCIYEKRYLLLGWVVIGMYVPYSFTALPTMALVAGFGFSKTVVERNWNKYVVFLSSRIGIKEVIITLVVLYSVGSNSAYLIPERILGDKGLLNEKMKLTDSSVESARWIENNLDSSSRVLFIGSLNEWGPGLSERNSILTPFGSEWTGRFERIKNTRKKIKSKKCIENVLSTLEKNAKNATHILLRKKMFVICNRQQKSVKALFENKNHIIYEVIEAGNTN